LAALALQPDAGGFATIALSGRLDAYSVGPLWAQAHAALRANPRAKVVVDCGRVEYCDGAGVALLVDLLRQPRPPGAEVEVRGLADRFQKLLDQFDPKALAAGPAVPPRLPLLERIGRAGARFFDDLYALVAFLGEAAAAIAYALRHPQGIRWQDALRIAEEAGVNALPIVALIGFLMGVILAFQSAVAMKPFGAELFVANLLSLALLRELGPLMTAILLAGRSGAAFAAEIGTMKVNQEVDALTTMGLDPVRFLVVPRVIAAVAVMPFLILIFDLAALLGGVLIYGSLGYSAHIFYERLVWSSRLADFVGGLGKGLVFAALVAAAGCLRGIETRIGASSVGVSTTRAVVSGIVLIVVADGIMAAVLYALGI